MGKGRRSLSSNPQCHSSCMVAGYHLDVFNSGRGLEFRRPILMRYGCDSTCQNLIGCLLLTLSLQNSSAMQLPSPSCAALVLALSPASIFCKDFWSRVATHAMGGGALMFTGVHHAWASRPQRFPLLRRKGIKHSHGIPLAGFIHLTSCG